MKRQFDPASPELMDRPQPISPELESDLRNLRELNRLFGGHSLIRKFSQHWILPGNKLRVLDLATASGDIPRLIIDHARRVGAELQIDAIDQQESTIAIARRLSAHYPEIVYHCADVFSWDESGYDIVFCSLALHHFGRNDAVRLLGECRALSQRFVLVADLRRGFFATLAIHVLTAVAFREPMTQHDARASARRAFSFREFRALARDAGWKNFRHRRFHFARQAIWLDLEQN